jgi:hypothetical protein
MKLMVSAEQLERLADVRPQYDQHVRDYGTFKTEDMARDLIGTAMLRDPSTIAEDEGFRFNAEAFDAIAFVCLGCEWCCSMDEANDDEGGGGWWCDECNAEQGGD